jgi:hypothetical protein
MIGFRFIKKYASIGTRVDRIRGASRREFNVVGVPAGASSKVSEHHEHFPYRLKSDTDQE